MSICEGGCLALGGEVESVSETVSSLYVGYLSSNIGDNLQWVCLMTTKYAISHERDSVS